MYSVLPSIPEAHRPNKPSVQNVSVEIIHSFDVHVVIGSTHSMPFLSYLEFSLGRTLMYMYACMYVCQVFRSSFQICYINTSSTLDGSEVKGSSYKQGLKELMDVCTLCNDSGLAYNEVRSRR
jgi:hypothetical protein